MTLRVLNLMEKHFEVPVTVFLQHVLYIKPMDSGGTTFALMDGSSLDVKEELNDILIDIYG